MGRITGDEPALGQSGQGDWFAEVSGQEPMLGGQRRPRLDRELFWDLLDMDGDRRLTAAEVILEQGAGRFYGAAMIAVLAPGARYFQPGRLWKMPYSYEHKLAAMDSLMRLDPAHALAGLVVALNNQDSGIQRIAIWFIGQLETEEAQSALLTILDDPRPELRYVAFYALSERWGLPALKRLVSPKGYTVSEAARVLGRCLETPRVLDPLIVALREDRESAGDKELAQTALIEAVVSLVQHLGDQDKTLAVEALAALLDNRRTSRIVADAAVEGLRRIDTPDARAAAIRYQSGHDTLDRLAVNEQPSGNGQHFQRT
ncbi:MAG: HEAT repeat domain-containing protein [Anaerolineae bacterium]|nr:HEAT repeat domain-containing protein [Anaerolineae bacterium]